MSDDNPYDLLGDGEGDDHRWAYGTGFTDALAGIDTAVPPHVDRDALATYCLMLGDDALIYSHRLEQWITRMPELEEETALANVALDLLGQARMLLARAGTILGRTEDNLAYFRDAHEFRNVRLVERADEDFAELVTRLLIFSSWRLATLEQLVTSRDPVLAAIAGKGVKEISYHRDYAGQWVVRLGDGTDVSKAKAQAALTTVWPLVDELFRTNDTEKALPRTAADSPLIRAEVDVVLDTVLATAGLDRPDVAPLAAIGGRTGLDGLHTEALSYVLAELQSVARSDPDAEW